jgi:hypothetical protein
MLALTLLRSLTSSTLRRIKNVRKSYRVLSGTEEQQNRYYQCCDETFSGWSGSHCLRVESDAARGAAGDPS